MGVEARTSSIIIRYRPILAINIGYRRRAIIVIGLEKSVSVTSSYYRPYDSHVSKKVNNVANVFVVTSAHLSKDDVSTIGQPISNYRAFRGNASVTYQAEAYGDLGSRCYISWLNGKPNHVFHDKYHIFIYELTR